MSIHSYIEKHWVKRSILSYLFLPFAFIFSLILRFRRYLFDVGIFPRYKADAFIVSVGNLTVGGNGKTPFTIMLANILKDEGMKIVVSHRGYKGDYEHMIKLISDETEIFQEAYSAGDESLLLAENLPGVPVIVGSDRKKAIQYVQRILSPDVIILDDSFQHLKVRHDFDFLLLNGKNPLGNGFVTPAGMLREPANAMKYADCFVFNNIPHVFDLPRNVTQYKSPIITTSYKITNIIHYIDDKNFNPEYFNGKNVLLVSGIGNPASFEINMKECGYIVVEHMTFADHHEFSNEDIDIIMKKFDQLKADAIISTEKDFVKLRNFHTDMSNFYYAKLNPVINEQDTFRDIIRKLRKEIGSCNS